MFDLLFEGDLDESWMEAGKCMNVACGATEPGGEWRRGWGLRSGGFASLCVKCGYCISYLLIVFFILFWYSFHFAVMAFDIWYLSWINWAFRMNIGGNFLFCLLSIRNQD